VKNLKFSLRKQPVGAKVDAFKLQINLFPHIKKSREFPLCDENEILLHVANIP